MKPTDFSKYLTDFLTRYLPHERGASANTICSYRDTFIAYLAYMESNGIKAEKLMMVDITKTHTVSFLDWLEKERKCSVSTRNLRLAAIHSFFKYVQYQSKPPANPVLYEVKLLYRTIGFWMCFEGAWKTEELMQNKIYILDSNALSFAYSRFASSATSSISGS